MGCEEEPILLVELFGIVYLEALCQAKSYQMDDSDKADLMLLDENGSDLIEFIPCTASNLAD